MADELKLPDKRKWPKYDNYLQSVLLDFIANYYDEIEHTLATYDRLIGTCGNIKELENTRKFWKHAQSTLRWLASRVGHKQKNLMIRKLLAEQLKDEKTCGNSSDNSSLKEQLRGSRSKPRKRTGPRS